jgi:hypothetical protein
VPPSEAVLSGSANAKSSTPIRAPCSRRENQRGSCFVNMLARCPHCWHYESMAIQINIRDVPEKVRDELAARAALQGKSMQEFLRAELERLAARPSIDAWLQQVRKRKRATQTRISSKQILENRNADRR